MMAGEEAYLLPRDQGPVRAYVRDIVDARRNLLGLFMPAALFMIFVMLGCPAAAVLRLTGHAGADARDGDRRPAAGPQPQQGGRQVPSNTESS
jgi:hypothetical protein